MDEERLPPCVRRLIELMKDEKVPRDVASRMVARYFKARNFKLQALVALLEDEPQGVVYDIVQAYRTSDDFFNCQDIKLIEEEYGVSLCDKARCPLWHPNTDVEYVLSLVEWVKVDPEYKTLLVKFKDATRAFEIPISGAVSQPRKWAIELWKIIYGIYGEEVWLLPYKTKSGAVVNPMHDLIKELLARAKAIDEDDPLELGDLLKNMVSLYTPVDRETANSVVEKEGVPPILIVDLEKEALYVSSREVLSRLSRFWKLNVRILGKELRRYGIEKRRLKFRTGKGIVRYHYYEIPEHMLIQLTGLTLRDLVRSVEEELDEDSEAVIERYSKKKEEGGGGENE